MTGSFKGFLDVFQGSIRVPLRLSVWDFFHGSIRAPLRVSAWDFFQGSMFFKWSFNGSEAYLEVPGTLGFL